MKEALRAHHMSYPIKSVRMVKSGIFQGEQ